MRTWTSWKLSTVRIGSASLSKEKVDKVLYIAMDKEKENTVKLLLTKVDADANATGPEFGDALTAAAHDGAIEIVNMLLQKGAMVMVAGEISTTVTTIKIPSSSGQHRCDCQTTRTVLEACRGAMVEISLSMDLALAIATLRARRSVAQWIIMAMEARDLEKRKRRVMRANKVLS